MKATENLKGEGQAKRKGSSPTLLPRLFWPVNLSFGVVFYSPHPLLSVGSMSKSFALQNKPLHYTNMTLQQSRNIISFNYLEIKKLGFGLASFILYSQL